MSTFDSIITQNARRGTYNSTLGIVMAVVSVSLLAGCKDEAPAPATAQPIQVMTVSFAPRSEKWSYVGTVRPRYETDLGFRVGGKIVERLVDIGQRVAAGEVLARLDATDFRLAFQSQEAELSAALSNREQAVAAEQRYRILLAQGHVAQAAMEQRVVAADEARSRVERAERSLALARNQLSYVELKTDHAGVISVLPVEVGQVIAAGQMVARLARLDELDAVVAIPEQNLAAARTAEADVELWSDSKNRFNAKLRELSPEADPISRTYQARFAIERPNSDVQLGRTVTLHMRSGGGAQVTNLPISAVMNDGRGATVWVVDSTGSQVVRTPVELLALSQEVAVIGGGLRSGDRVVTLGVHMLDEKKPVRVVERHIAIR